MNASADKFKLSPFLCLNEVKPMLETLENSSLSFLKLYVLVFTVIR
jgi:hypothetical protein